MNPRRERSCWTENHCTSTHANICIGRYFWKCLGTNANSDSAILEHVCPLFDVDDVVFISCKLAWVSQDLELFSGSLRDNIEYGLKGCTYEKVQDAAKKAKADAFFSELKDQYDTGTQTQTLVLSCLSYEKSVCTSSGSCQMDESETTHRKSRVSVIVCFSCAAVEGGGVTLSSGLRHSVALIRALVRDPQVIILDETTSKVDTDVWHAVSKRLDHHMS